jgi:hypothetical protein
LKEFCEDLVAASKYLIRNITGAPQSSKSFSGGEKDGFWVSMLALGAAYPGELLQWVHEEKVVTEITNPRHAWMIPGVVFIFFIVAFLRVVMVPAEPWSFSDRNFGHFTRHHAHHRRVFFPLDSVEAGNMMRDSEVRDVACDAQCSPTVAVWAVKRKHQ